MSGTIVELKENVSDSPLYSPDLAPVPAAGRTWNLWNIAAIWVGMAVCIPTYLLASYMIKSGLGWFEALVIIFVANLIVTIPMILNGHAGVKYGIPFPVLGRASFGTAGVHAPSIVRGIVACGWFGIQTWIGGLAFYAIWCAATGAELQTGLSVGKFVGFLLFWLVNIFFIWRGTESIRWLENFAAPILILMGLFLIGWGVKGAGGFGVVLKQSQQMKHPAAVLATAENGSWQLQMHPLSHADGRLKANAFRAAVAGQPIQQQPWRLLSSDQLAISLTALFGADEIFLGEIPPQLKVQYQGPDGAVSSVVQAVVEPKTTTPRWSTYLFWLTAMVGFWATMSISIADITRYAKTQREQIVGQFLGLPGTMLLYSFVGVFVTCAALIQFGDILIADDAPWDPVSLLGKFKSPAVVIVAQIFMLIATLSTNIAANVIAPANAFANAFPRKLSFRSGGVITGLIGIAICPWWLLDEISGLLIFVSGLLGPVLGVMLSDYLLVRRKQLALADLFKTEGIYRFSGGVNPAAMVSLAVGVLVALIGFWVPKLGMLYTMSWFTGFACAFTLYFFMMKGSVKAAQS